jgi:hypothetical protein
MGINGMIEFMNDAPLQIGNSGGFHAVYHTERAERAEISTEGQYRWNNDNMFSNFISHEILWHGLLNKSDDWFAEDGNFGSSAVTVDQLMEPTDKDCCRVKKALEVR